MRVWTVTVIAVAAALLNPAPAGATQAYNDWWGIVQAGDASQRAITRCRTLDDPQEPGMTTEVKTRGGHILVAGRARIIPGQGNNLDNVILARRFKLLRAATEPNATNPQRVTSCEFRRVNGNPRLVMGTRSGQKWALIRPRAGRYFTTCCNGDDVS